MIKKPLLEDYDGDEYHSGGTSIICPYCYSTIMDLIDYIRCHTFIEEYSKRDDKYEYLNKDVVENKWYIPNDSYNQEITHCHCCGKKIQWKYLYLEVLKNE